MGFGQCDCLGAAEIAIDLIRLAADLRDRRTHGVGAVAMRHSDHLRNPGDPIGHEKGAAADRDQRQITGLGLHPIDRILDLPSHRGEDGMHEVSRQVGDGSRVPDFNETGGNLKFIAVANITMVK